MIFSCLLVYCISEHMYHGRTCNISSPVTCLLNKTVSFSITIRVSLNRYCSPVSNFTSFGCETRISSALDAVCQHCKSIAVKLILVAFTDSDRQNLIYPSPEKCSFKVIIFQWTSMFTFCKLVLDNYQ